MKTNLLYLVFLFAFAVTTTAAPQKDQANPNSFKHPLIELYKKVHMGNIDQPYKSQKLASQLYLNSVEHQGGGNFISYYKVDHIYQAGLRTETRHQYQAFVEAEWQTTSREVYVYEFDRLTSITNQINTEQGFVDDYRTLFTYQMNGGQYFLHEIIDQYWNSELSDWINDERVVLIMSNGKISIGESNTWIDNEWYTYELFFLEQQGDDLYVTYQEPYGHLSQNWMYTERQVYKNFTIDALYNLFLEEINLIDTGAYLYYAQLFPDYTEQYWTGSDWQDNNRQITENNYNWQTGEMISKNITGQFLDDEWTTSTQVTISYDAGNISEMVLYLAETEELDDLYPVYAEQYEYNAMGVVQYIVQKQAANEAEETVAQNEMVILGRLVLHWSETPTSIEMDYTPDAFKLGNAYPNPFNPSTMIPFEVQAAGEISIQVYDILGRHVSTLASGMYPSGKHSVRFDATGLSSGVYYIRMSSPSLLQTRSVTLVK